MLKTLYIQYLHHVAKRNMNIFLSINRRYNVGRYNQYKLMKATRRYNSALDKLDAIGIKVSKYRISY